MNENENESPAQDNTDMRADAPVEQIPNPNLTLTEFERLEVVDSGPPPHKKKKEKPPVDPAFFNHYL